MSSDGQTEVLRGWSELTAGNEPLLSLLLCRWTPHEFSSEPEGVRYLIDDGRRGLPSPVGDAPALAHNVIRLLTDPELATRIAANAYEQSKLYGWSAVREQWLEVYDELHTPAKAQSRKVVTQLLAS